MVKAITSELFDLWEKSAIPFKSKIDCDHVVRTLITKWRNARKDEKMTKEFQRDLDKLLDLRTAECMNLNSLKVSLKARGNGNWKTDYLFFKGQLTFPQTSSMSGKDKVLDKKLKEKSAKIAKRELFNEMNKGDFHPEHQDTGKEGCPSSSTSSTSALSTENILHPSEKRQKKTAEVESTECHSVDEDSAESQVVSGLQCAYLLLK